MPVLVVLIVLSFVFYLFYKVRYIRSARPAEKQWISAKSRTALGLFVALFGLNQIFLFPSTLTYVIAGIFLLLGSINVWTGLKARKYYLPFAIKEAKNVCKK
ncbi:YtpI family protein [Bacillaceae bacterium Marseille-Q3522]|nr:YtpI family protein [Bacillaceae bacterium Marseille-Q3522]